MNEKQYLEQEFSNTRVMGYSRSTLRLKCRSVCTTVVKEAVLGVKNDSRDFVCCVCVRNCVTYAKVESATVIFCLNRKDDKATATNKSGERQKWYLDNLHMTVWFNCIYPRAIAAEILVVIKRMTKTLLLNH